MTRHDGLKICDAHVRPEVQEDGSTIYHGIVVDDGKSNLDGMIECIDGTCKVYGSEPYRTDRGNYINISGSDKKELHFCNRGCAVDYLVEH